jgi:hypothetical protein
LYQRLGVDRDADLVTLRAAYRRLARLLHPDVAGPAAADGVAMIDLNEAWWVLSDPQRRRAYDSTLPRPTAKVSSTSETTGRASEATRRASGTTGRAASNGQGKGPAATATSSPVGSAGFPPPASTAASVGARREAWLVSLRLQIRRLGTQAARSAVQTLAVRHRGVPRASYETLIDPVVTHLLSDTGERVRVARVAGAAPLDLAIGAALLGLRSYAATLMARAGRYGVTAETAATAEMVDRMWDTMAHEIPRELELALGGNPRAARRVR